MLVLFIGTSFVTAKGLAVFMEIMCLNGWGGKMHAQLLPYLQSTQPDVLCLQEVVHTPSADKSVLTYRDVGTELPQSARFFDDVCAALPHHSAFFCPAALGDLWDGDTRYESYWGLATFVHKSIPIIGQAQGFVHKAFSANGYGDHPRSRSAHAVRLHDSETGSPLTISHMHGLRDLAGKHDTPERRVQAQRLRDLTFSIVEAGDQIVICGDFNVLPDSVTFDLFARDGLADLVISRGFQGTRNSQYKKPGKFADYMLINDELAHARFDVIYDPEVSDHCPLVLNTSQV